MSGSGVLLGLGITVMGARADADHRAYGRFGRSGLWDRMLAAFAALAGRVGLWFRGDLAQCTGADT
eukprot:2672507-Pleurochrysis_carterae.AAC.1